MIKIYHELEQGSDEWFKARCGLLTASEMKLILTPKLKICSNDKERAHVYEIASQKISGYVEPSYIGDDMLRGSQDEIDAREVYIENYEDVKEVGFITNDKWGFTLGYSPDGLVGPKGLIEVKSRKQKFQIETIAKNEVPAEYIFQLQFGMLVSERGWIDFISYSAGLPMFKKTVYPDREIQVAIIESAQLFYKNVDKKIEEYKSELKRNKKNLIETERVIEEEMY